MPSDNPPQADELKKQPGILAGSFLFFIGSLLVYAARFVTSVIVARTLGVEGKGIYALVLMVGSLLVLFYSFGLGNSITYFTANRQYSPASLFAFSLSATLLISMVGGILFYFAYQVFLGERILAGVTMEHVWLILISLPFSLLITFLSSIVHGRQQFVEYNLITLARVFSNLLFQIVSSLLKGGIYGAILAWLASNVLAFGVSLWYVREDIRLSIFVPRAMLKPMTSYGLKNYITNLLTFFNLRLDTFFVNYFSGSMMVGLYTTGVSAAELVWYVPNAIGSALFPKSSAMPRETAARLTAQICRQALLVSTLLVLASAVLGPILIPLFYGLDFKASITPFLWLLPGILGISLSKIIAANLGGIGKPQYATYTSVATIVITIVLDILLIPLYSIVGAAIASSIAYLFTAGMLVYWFGKETGIRIPDVLIPRREDLVLLFSRTMVLWRQLKARIA